MKNEKTDILSSVYKSFNPRFYTLIFDQQMLSSLLYVWFLMFVVTTALFFIYWPLQMKAQSLGYKEAYTEGLPQFRVGQGRAGFDGEQPFQFTTTRNFDTREYTYMAMLDTSDTGPVDIEKFEEAILRDYGEAVIVYSTRIYFRLFDAQQLLVQEIDAEQSDIDGAEYIHETFTGLLEKQKIPNWINAVISGLLFSTIGVMLVVLVFFGITKMLAKRFAFTWTFNIVCYAATPFMLALIPLSGVTSKSTHMAVLVPAIILSSSLIYAATRQVARFLNFQVNSETEQTE
jgi:Protein of unknown function (DUF1189)